jgi:hypothetical protein
MPKVNQLTFHCENRLGTRKRGPSGSSCLTHRCPTGHKAPFLRLRSLAVRRWVLVSGIRGYIPVER